MTTKFETSSFFEQSGNLAAEFSEKLRDGIVTHTCNLWSAYPKFFTNNKNPATSWTRGYMNQVCSPIQPPVPLPPPNFTGGQCTGIPYTVTVRVKTASNTNSGFTQDATRTFTVIGPVTDLQFIPSGTFGSTASSQFGGFTVFRHDIRLASNAGNPFLVGSAFNLIGGQPTDPPNEIFIISVVRDDGLPDNCGSLPPSYPPEVRPTQIDLSTTINITNLDGTDNFFDLTWNQVDANFNFPFNFKLNGINVTLSLGGLTIHGNNNITNNNGGDGSPNPGSDGGKDVDGNDYQDDNPEWTYPELPEFTVPDLVEETLEYALCELNVVNTVSETIKVLPGTSALFQTILTVLANIVEDICAETEVSDVGIPELFPVLPGADRPIVMFYYKEIIAGKRSFSTYVSTIPRPNAATVADLENLSPPDRTLGKVVVALKLLDGSRIVARAETETQANAYFNYLLTLTTGGIIPPNIETVKSTTRIEKFAVVEVKCTQIEYYPEGKSFGRTPSVLVLLDPT